VSAPRPGRCQGRRSTQQRPPQNPPRCRPGPSNRSLAPLRPPQGRTTSDRAVVVRVVSVRFGLQNMNGIQRESLERWSVQFEPDNARSILDAHCTYRVTSQVTYTRAAAVAELPVRVRMRQPSPGTEVGVGPSPPALLVCPVYCVGCAAPDAVQPPSPPGSRSVTIAAPPAPSVTDFRRKPTRCGLDTVGALTRFAAWGGGTAVATAATAAGAPTPPPALWRGRSPHRGSRPTYSAPTLGYSRQRACDVKRGPRATVAALLTPSGDGPRESPVSASSGERRGANEVFNVIEGNLVYKYHQVVYRLVWFTS